MACQFKGRCNNFGCFGHRTRNCHVGKSTTPTAPGKSSAKKGKSKWEHGPKTTTACTQCGKIGLTAKYCFTCKCELEKAQKANVASKNSTSEENNEESDEDASQVVLTTISNDICLSRKAVQTDTANDDNLWIVDYSATSHMVCQHPQASLI